MQTRFRFGNRILAAAAFALLLAPAGVPAHAVSKETVELQTQVQQLLDMVQRLQSTMDTKFALVQNLVQQTADQSNQMTAAVNALQKQVQAQNDAVGGKTDALSGQMQGLNDSVDEVKSRIAKLDKSIQDLQNQMQQMQSQAAAAPGTGQGSMPGALPGASPNGNAPGAGPGAGPDTGAGQGMGQGAGANTPQSGIAPGGPGGGQAPPLNETYQAGVRDFSAAHYQLAASEFQDVVHYYPLDDLSGSAQFYLGEIAYQQQDYETAIKYYNAVLNGFAGNSKAPTAQLHKGLALIATNKKEQGIRELRLLIQRHPQTPDAARARSKLNGMGVKIVAAE